MSHPPKHSWVKISQVRTLATERIGKRIARLSPEKPLEIQGRIGIRYSTAR